MKRFFLGLICACSFYSCSNKEESKAIEEEQTDSITTNNETIDEQAIVKAPEFTYTDINGNEVSLSDFRGKLVYMDIWATWCGPCKMQIPALKKLEEKYKNEDIVILSVSIDPEKDKGKWKQMVKDEQLKGVQLYAGAESNFPMDYQVEYIPRFVLISAKGDILMDNAPQPMNMETGGINPGIEQIFEIYLKTNKKATS